MYGGVCQIAFFQDTKTQTNIYDIKKIDISCLYITKIKLISFWGFSKCVPCSIQIINSIGNVNAIAFYVNLMIVIWLFMEFDKLCQEPKPAMMKLMLECPHTGLLLNDSKPYNPLPPCAYMLLLMLSTETNVPGPPSLIDSEMHDTDESF